jgi:hypothetical protein
VELFSALVDQLAAYESDANPLHYATHFVDGLCDDIHSMVMIQRSATFDYSCALALVQEETMESGKRRKPNAMNHFPTGRFIGLLIPYLLHPS